VTDVLIDWEKAGNVLASGGQIIGQIGIAGLSAVVRIPVPGTRGLAIELGPRGWTPRGGTTSRLFVQDIAGSRVLRLDYGFNQATNAVEFHWNQKGTFAEFGIANHTPAGPGGAALGRGLAWFRWGGRIMLIAAAAADIYSIIVSDQPWRQVAIVAGGWAGAWLGCESVGAIGAVAGTFAEPGGGTAVGGIAGCFVGSIGGYWAGKTLVVAAMSPRADTPRASVQIFRGLPPGAALERGTGPSCSFLASGCSPSVAVYKS